MVGRALREPKVAKSSIPNEGESENLPLIGRSPSMQDVYRVMARLMHTDLTVLISGESGTGKELVARALHDYGQRRKGPFIAINMAAIPRELIELEFSAMRRAPSPARRSARSAASNRRTAERSFSTKSAICRWRRRRDFCACCRKANT